MVGLTASLPIKTSLEYKIIKTFFGTPLKFESKITKIPVYFTDLRDQNKKRGFCDSNYNALDDIDAFNFYSDFMLKNNILPSIEYKLIIMTSSIDTSIYDNYGSAKVKIPTGNLTTGWCVPDFLDVLNTLWANGNCIPLHASVTGTTPELLSCTLFVCM